MVTVAFVLGVPSRDSLLASVSPEIKLEKWVVRGRGKEGRNPAPFEVLAALFFESIGFCGGQALSPAPRLQIDGVVEARQGLTDGCCDFSSMEELDAGNIGRGLDLQIAHSGQKRLGPAKNCGPRGSWCCFMAGSPFVSQRQRRLTR